METTGIKPIVLDEISDLAHQYDVKNIIEKADIEVKKRTLKRKKVDIETGKVDIEAIFQDVLTK
jgi:hypothetical protein